MSEEIVRCARCKRILTGKAAKYWGMGGVCRAKAPGMAARIQAEKAGQQRLFPAGTAEEIAQIPVVMEVSR